MKLGICNELFKGWQLDRLVPFIKELGYDGVEIAPFTLADSVRKIPGEKRRAIRTLAEKNDLEIIGTHWLLVKPEGLSISSRDKESRLRTAEYFKDLVVFTAEIGGSVMVLGSPKQRSFSEGQTYREVRKYFQEVISPALLEAEKCGVWLCLEPLTRKETNFVNTARQAVQIIKDIGHPNLGLILDVKAMSDEGKALPEIIRESAGYLKHFHANDKNRLGPGSGEIDYGPIVKALRDIGYQGYLSVEVFDFSPGPETIAGRSIEYLKRFL